MGKVLITGANGQLGRCIKDEVTSRKDIKNSYSSSDVIGNGVVLEFDLLEPIESIYETIKDYDVIINCAAYTNVNGCETDELSEKVNVEAVKKLAKLTRSFGKKLIHISTDYVFYGEENKPYSTTSTTAPLSRYGLQKRNAENYIKSLWPLTYDDDASRMMVIRTSWLYSMYGHNFVKTIMNKVKNNDEIKVVYDQVGTPTYARDLAKFIVDVVENDAITNGIFHYSNEGVASWYDFAEAIKEYMSEDAVFGAPIVPTRTDYKTCGALRPHFSVMSKEETKERFRFAVIPYWRDSLKKCIKELSENAKKS